MEFYLISFTRNTGLTKKRKKEKTRKHVIRENMKTHLRILRKLQAIDLPQTSCKEIALC